ncbi:MAG: efflux RND transporter permease subunit [Planctomycetota bacterium]
MNLPRASVQRPVFTTMVVLIAVTLGLVSLDRLRIDLLPEVEMPTVNVSTEYDGAAPDVMESLVTQILEEILATVPGVEEMTSTSEEGETRVRMTFGWGTNVDTAVTEIRAKLEDELEELPEGVLRPRVRNFDVNSFPVVLLGISSSLDPVELTTVIEEQIRYRFARIPGVAQVDLWGGYNREVRVELDPARLRALSLPLDTVLEALRNANVDAPTGEIESGRYELTLRAPAEFGSIDEIKRTVITVRNGGPIILDQIATVEDTYERLTRRVRINGQPGVRAAVRKQADANTVEVSKAIAAEIERVNHDFRQLDVVAVLSQGNFIERSIKNVATSVVYGGGLAVLVLLAFLRDLRSTSTIALSIPVSLVATISLVYLGGFTLNLMTLGGLALGVGMMVDNSIVVLENIFRKHKEDHLSPADAAVKGASEVAGAIVASTLTTLVVFLPVVFVQGVSGVLFRELAMVIVFSLVCSLLVSLSVVPMLASKLLKRKESHASPSEVEETSEENWFTRALDRGLRFRIATVLGTLAVLGGSLSLVPNLGAEFLPPSDEGEVRIRGEMEVGTRLDIIDRQIRTVEEIVLEAVPERTAWVTTAGEEAEGDIRLSLVPAAERTRSNSEIAQDLRNRLENKIPGMEIRTRAPQGQFVLERILGGDEGLGIEIRGFDLDTLALLSGRVAEAVEQVEGVSDVDVDRDEGTPQARLQIDRAKAADLGITARDIVRVLETSIAGSRAGDFRPEGNAYRILVQLRDARGLELDEVLDLTISSASGEQVALRNLVSVTPGRGPTEIRRKNQQRLVTVTANVAGRDLASVAADVEAKLAEIARPTGYEMVLSGKVEEQRESSRQLSMALALSLILVYMVLACQYESLRDPVIVMTAVPLAVIGVVLTLFLTGTTLNLQSYIGIIMLGGIVVNNAILLVDQATRLRREGMTADRAVVEASRRRFRPIFMTSLTTMLGLAPLALGIGEGADAQAPLARAVVGGLAGALLTTLVVVPAVYSLVYGRR